MSCSLPSFSKKLSSGSFRFSVQFAINALKREKEDILNVFLPMRSKEDVKKKTVSKAKKTEDKSKKKKETPRLYPIRGLIRKTGMMHNIGCNKEETKTLPVLTKDIVKNTTERRINTAQNPNKKSLTQTSTLLRKTLTALPRKMNPNHRMIE